MIIYPCYHNNDIKIRWKTELKLVWCWGPLARGDWSKMFLSVKIFCIGESDTISLIWYDILERNTLIRRKHIIVHKIFLLKQLWCGFQTVLKITQWVFYFGHLGVGWDKPTVPHSRMEKKRLPPPPPPSPPPSSTTTCSTFQTKSREERIRTIRQRPLSDDST